MILHRSGKFLQIHTPEGVVFNQRIAAPFSRLLALCLDLGAISAVSSLVGIVTAFLAIVSPDFARGLSVILYFVLGVGYGIFTEWYWRGQSWGKRVMGLRVVDAAGLKLQPSQIIIRNLLRPVDLLPVGYLLGGLVSFWSPRGQRLGDLAANTTVVAISGSFSVDAHQIAESKYNSFREYPHLEARLRQNVSPTVAALALDAVLRRDEFSPEARVRLFSEFAGFLRTVVPFEDHVNEAITDEQFVRNSVSSIYRQNVRLR